VIFGNRAIAYFFNLLVYYSRKNKLLNFDSRLCYKSSFMKSFLKTTLVYTSTYLEPELEIVLWPNPTQNTLNLRVPYAVESIAFYDLIGRSISVPFSYDGTDVKVSMANLPKGVYVVSINGNRVLESIVRL